MEPKGLDGWQIKTSNPGWHLLEFKHYTEGEVDLEFTLTPAQWEDLQQATIGV